MHVTALAHSHLFLTGAVCDLFTPLLVVNGHVSRQLRAFKFDQLHPDRTVQVYHYQAAACFAARRSDRRGVNAGSREKEPD